MKWYGVFTRIHYDDGTHCDLTDYQPSAIFRDKETAEEMAVMMSAPLRGGCTTKIVKEIHGHFRTDPDSQGNRIADDDQGDKSER